MKLNRNQIENTEIIKLVNITEIQIVDKVVERLF